MSGTKKAAQVVAHLNGGEQARLDGFDELPEFDFTTVFCPMQGTLAALLPRERAAALTTKQLARITGQPPREITRRICLERRAGAPILSDPAAGFWLAADADELRRCAQALHKRAGEIHRTARALEKIVRRGGENNGGAFFCTCS